MSDPKDRFAQELAGGELEALTDAWSEALSARPVEAPSPGRRAALLAATQEAHRFEELVAPVAEAADLSEDAVAALLRAIDDPARWAAGPAPGVDLLHFEGGPKTARA
ncbi:MAG TPA: hypothetical protein RMI62_15145, partial [Polyangiaceae bacterium LLY-WYZ-15_(1-7)]|nr:hypothetical protein [Polyangiaceae bacterium LLY-WYZ-15_(1-7)]